MAAVQAPRERGLVAAGGNPQETQEIVDLFCSQYEEKDWYNQICDGESTLADAIMDRISFDSYKINIEYIDKSVDKSMREVYGLNPSEAQ